MKFYRGPLNDNFGFDPELAAPAAQIEAAAKFEGQDLWTALENCQWIDEGDLPEGAIICGTHAYGDRLVLDGPEEEAE